MSIRGRIDQGKVVTETPLEFPDGTEVEIRPVSEAPRHHPDVERFAGILSADSPRRDYYAHIRKKHT